MTEVLVIIAIVNAAGLVALMRFRLNLFQAMLAALPLCLTCVLAIGWLAWFLINIR